MAADRGTWHRLHRAIGGDLAWFLLRRLLWIAGSIVAFLGAASLWTDGGLGEEVWAVLAERESFVRGTIAVAGLLLLLRLVRGLVTDLAALRRGTPVARGAAAGTGLLGQRPMPRSRRARHEAAHVVVARALGQRVVLADIIVRGGAEGRTEWRTPDHGVSGYTEASWISLIIAVSGHVSDVDGGDIDSGSMSDMNQVIIGALQILSAGQRPTGFTGPMTLDALSIAAMDRAREVLHTEAEAVDAIAAALEANADNAALLEADLNALWDEHHHARTGDSQQR
jgi:hypothetical protein